MIAFFGLVMLAIALGLGVLGNWLADIDEVYSLAVYAMGILLFFWGLAIAPSATPLTLGVLALGWVQVNTPKP